METLRLTEHQWRAIVNGPVFRGDKDRAKQEMKLRGYTVVVYDTQVKRCA